jgi:preprotein translocase subunit YajC
MESLLPLLVLALAFFVLIVLPMRTRNRQLQATRRMQAELAVGTEVMTTSGLYGRIVGLTDDTADLEVSPGVVVRWARAAIAEVRVRSSDQPAAGGEPGPASKANGEPADPV